MFCTLDIQFDGACEAPADARVHVADDGDGDNVGLVTWNGAKTMHIEVRGEEGGAILEDWPLDARGTPTAPIELRHADDPTTAWTVAGVERMPFGGGAFVYLNGEAETRAGEYAVLYKSPGEVERAVVVPYDAIPQPSRRAGACTVGLAAAFVDDGAVGAVLLDDDRQTQMPSHAMRPACAAPGEDARERALATFGGGAVHTSNARALVPQGCAGIPLRVRMLRPVAGGARALLTFMLS